MPSATQVLLSEHARLRSALHTARAALQALGAGGPETLPLDLPSLQDWIGGLTTHATKENQILFPAVERLIGSTNGPTAVMRLEHQEIDRRAQHFIETLNRFGDRPIRVEPTPASHGPGRNDSRQASTVALAESFDELADLLQSHFEKEEQVLFPLTESLLSPAQQQELGAELAAFPGEI